MNRLAIPAARRACSTRWSSRWARPLCAGGIESKFRTSRLFSQTAAVSQSDSKDKDDKPYYVTTPIFYVNAAPHVGHLSSMIMADVFKRWHALKGKKSFLSTGTDEHGLKVQRAAQIQAVTPKNLCDANSETFRDLVERSDISADHFVRTTDPDHVLAVETFWAALERNGHVYETKHQGWYCVSDETYYPETHLARRIAPITGKSYMASIETGNSVEWIEEKNYHFRLTAFKDQLLQFYKDNPEWIVPETRMDEVIDWVTHNLEDLSISRPANRLDWGIRVPNDDSQTVYVWVDALVNYLTKAGYPQWQPGSESDGGWPADVHVIGKDIVRFHCVYWPALLMAAGFPLPRRVLSHNHWMLNESKMSKSTGNAVNPFHAIQRWGIDVMRYFLVDSSHRKKDSNYDNELITRTYKKDLQSGLGNFLNRIMLPKAWNPAEVVQRASQKPSLGKTPIAPELEKQIELLNTLKEKTSKALEEDLWPPEAMQRIMKVIYDGQKRMSKMEPWALVKQGPKEKDNAEEIIYTMMESLRIAGILLQPFIPGKAKEVLDRMGVQPERRTWEYADLYADNDYGTPLYEIPLGGRGARSLFPNLAVED